MKVPAMWRASGTDAAMHSDSRRSIHTIVVGSSADILVDHRGEEASMAQARQAMMSIGGD